MTDNTMTKRTNNDLQNIPLKTIKDIICNFGIVIVIVCWITLKTDAKQRNGKNSYADRQKSRNLSSSQTQSQNMLWSADSKRICQQNNTNPYGKIDTREQKHPSVFSDLTRIEMKGLLQYLFANIELNLTTPDKATIYTNNLYLAELHLPPKKAVLNYIDKGYRKPPREAHVILIRRGIKQPDVREIIVGPLHTPSYHRPVPYRPQSISFLKRPFTPIDDIVQNLTKLLDKRTGGMLQELYGGRLIQCGNRCLRLAEMTGMTSAISGERKILQWFNLYHFTEYWMLRPLDFAILVELTAGKYNIINIWFNGQVFKSIIYVLGYYKQNKHLIKKTSFPVPSKSSPLTMKKRGKSPFSVPLRNPSQISPDGKRYNLQGRKVIYMFWEFHVGMSPISGPRLFDIRFKGERIAYEISLQELTVFYSGYKPVDYTANYFDGGLLIGVRSKYLVPEVDCPHGATYLSAYFQLGKQEKPSYNPRAYCIFEFNTGIPLRRHHGSSKNYHRFYEGLVSVVLIVRTISTIGNYDYITDFIFYHNGAIEIKITASGVIIGTFHGHKNPYGFEISKNLMGPIHQHLYHFKVDLDIKGTKNRFSTIDIENDVIPNIWHKNVNENIHQTKFVERLKSTEKEAAHTFNFDEPKLLIFSNNKFNDKYGNTPGYKILNEGMSKNIRPPLKGNEPAMSWSQYQVAITKQKDDEPRSSSIYAHAGPDDPVVTFQDFIDDDENIVDEDIVAWVTMGMHHITIKEDLPVVHTPGMSKSFFLLPFNYFDESPAMGSHNAVRIDPVDRNGTTKSIQVQRYGVKDGIDCVPVKTRFDKILQTDVCHVVECL